MKLLAHLLSADPACPRVTFYDEAAGHRMEFSAQTLDNWAAKVANFLEEELDLTAGDCIALHMPACWPAVVIYLGAVAAQVDVSFDAASGAPAVFASTSTLDTLPPLDPGATLIVVSEDPFGRGVEDSGGHLPAGALDFFPQVRAYGDQYWGQAPALADAISAHSSSGRWACASSDVQALLTTFIGPVLAAGGSTVTVCGTTDSERIDFIASMERAAIFTLAD